jgi:Ca2+-binding EF-hand superfamily protein
MDKNSDGKLTEDEMPDRMKERFAAMDANNDKSVDKAEFIKAMEAFRAAGGGGNRREGPPGGARPEAGGGQ